MPVDYRDVDGIAAAAADIYAEGEYALIALLTRRLGAGGFESDTQAWAVRKLGEVRALRRTAAQLVDGMQRDGAVGIRSAVAAGWRSGNTTALTDLTEMNIGDIGPGARAADQRAGRAVQALADAVVRELRPACSAVLRSTDDAYRKAVAGAAARRLTGARDTRRAAQDAWSALVGQGVTSFHAGGRRWQLSTYVEMSVRTAVGRAAVIGETDAIRAASLTHCYVEDNPRECPLCLPFEGKILSLDYPPTAPATMTLADAQAEGLHHPQCRHRIRAWAPGVRIVPARRPDPGGYAAEQEQRRLERGLRAWRSRYAAAFDDQQRQYCARRITGWSQRLSTHLDAHPRLPRKTYREFPGAGFIAPRSARTRRDAAFLAPRA